MILIILVSRASLTLKMNDFSYQLSPSLDHKRQCPNVEKTCLFCSGKYPRASESQHLESCLAYWKHMAASYKKKAEELELEVQNLNDGLGERTSSGKLKQQP